MGMAANMVVVNNTMRRKDDIFSFQQLSVVFSTFEISSLMEA